MAGSLNKVALIGNLGRDPELRTMTNGNRMATLSLATAERWTDKHTGEKREKTEWHRVVIYNDRLVELAEKWLVKGMTIYLEGALETRKWTDQAGVEKYVTEIVMKAFRGEIVMLGGGKGNGDNGPAKSTGGAMSGSYNGPQDLDDEIPF